MSTIKIAVATKDGISINQHFGHAKEFKIYAMHQDQCLFVETRVVENYCLGNRSSKKAMSLILETLKDCDYVFVAKIGDGPIEKLSKINVIAVDEYAYFGIEDSIIQHLATEKL